MGTLSSRARRSAALSTTALAVLAMPSGALAQDALAGDEIALDTISVTANLTETPLDQVGSAVTVLTGEELRRQKITLVSEALRQVPGLSVNRTGPTGQLTQVRIRGSEGNQTLVFIDGIKANDPSAGSEFDFAHLLAEDIERIEVLRGPQSALYGSDAIGGVINIVTRKGRGGLHGTASAQGGSFDTLKGHASVSAGTETVNLLASATGFRTDGISVADERLGNSEKDGYRNGTVFAKAGFTPTENFELTGVARYTKFRTDTDAEAFYTEYGHTGPVDALQDTRGEQFYGRAQARLTLFDGRWEQVAGYSYTDNDRDYRDLDPTEVTSTYKGRMSRVDYRSSVFFDTPDLLDAAHTLTLALQHERDKAISKSAWSSFDRSVSSTGYIGEYQLSLIEDLVLTGSVRFDDNELFDNATTYRVTGAYRIEETGTKLRASYGTGVKNPTLFELYGYTNTYHGNPDLKPEKAEGWDAGFDQTLLGGLALLDVTYFNQRIGDLITGAGNTSVNLPGHSKIEGVEVGLTVEPVENVSVRASYTYTHGRDSSGAELVRRPANVASLNVNYRFLDDRANINLGIVYNGRQKDWVYSADYSEKQVVELDDYVLVNLAGSYEINPNMEVFGRLENILDEHYYEVWGYAEPGFGGYAGVRVTF